MDSSPISASSLRIAAKILSSTPSQRLPSKIDHLIHAITAASDLLSSGDSQASADSSGNLSVTVHKFKTQISTLLHSRILEGRWTATVLIKTTVEAGGWEVLKSCMPWVRGLLAILTRPDPVCTKHLAIVTLTRIYFLIQAHQSLAREIATPTLPTFIKSCLDIVVKNARAYSNARLLKNIDPLLGVVLGAYNHLLPQYPTVFRPFIPQIRPLTYQLLASTPSVEEAPFLEEKVSNDVASAARHVFARLHLCATKGTSGDEWTKTVRLVISEINITLNRVSRAVVEDWESAAASTNDNLQQTTEALAQPLGALNESMGLPPWTGIFAGAERILGLLSTLETFICCRTASAVNLPLGMVLDMLSRILTLVVPPNKRDSSQNSTRFNAEISRDEREGLFLSLPSIHRAGLSLLIITIERFQRALVPAAEHFVHHVTWLFSVELWNSEVRSFIYVALAGLLPLVGPSLSKVTSENLKRVVRSCCDDLVSSSQNQHEGRQNPPKTDADAFKPVGLLTTPIGPEAQTTLKLAASVVLPILFSHLPASVLTKSIRTQLEQTAILTSNKSAMLASVLEPPKGVKGKHPPSILPFLARAFGGDYDVEGLVRPRMPAIAPRDVVDDDIRAEEGGEQDVGATVDEYREKYEPYASHKPAEPLKDDTRLSQPTYSPAHLPGETAEPPLQDQPHPLKNLASSSPSVDTDNVHRSKRARIEDTEASWSLNPAVPRLSSNTASEPDEGGAVQLGKQDVSETNAFLVTPNADDSVNMDISAETSPVVGDGGGGRVGDEEDDNDDFEIPPLTADLDTSDDGSGAND